MLLLRCPHQPKERARHTSCGFSYRSNRGIYIHPVLSNCMPTACPVGPSQVRMTYTLRTPIHSDKATADQMGPVTPVPKLVWFSMVLTAGSLTQNWRSSGHSYPRAGLYPQVCNQLLLNTQHGRTRTRLLAGVCSLHFPESLPKSLILVLMVLLPARGSPWVTHRWHRDRCGLGWSNF